MRSEPRGRARTAALLLAAGTALAAGCRERAAEGGAAVDRFEGVRRQPAAPASAQGAFCDRTYPAGGEGARRWGAPPVRPLPGVQDPAPSPGTSWTWVNLWATWCAPCLDEMELLGRWREGFSRDGAAVAFELLSVDDADSEKALAAARAKGLPGAVRWVRSPDDLPPLLDALGVDRAAAIPIHALVDPAGWLRCVRVGAIHEQDWSAAKALVGR